MLRKANVIPVMTQETYKILSGDDTLGYYDFIRKTNLDDLLTSNYIGTRVYEALKQKDPTKLSPIEVLDVLISTTTSLINPAEIKGDGSDWSYTELSLLSRIIKVLPQVDVDSKKISLLFVSDLNSWPKEILLNDIGRDYNFSVEGLDKFLEQTILPSLLYANQLASAQPQGGVFTLPVLSPMFDWYRPHVVDCFHAAIQKLLKTHHQYLGHIKAVIITGMEKPEETIDDIRLLTTIGDQTGLYPEKVIPEIENCQLFACVATNPVSLPGGDANRHDPLTNEGIICSTTNLCSILAEGKDQPPTLGLMELRVLEGGNDWNIIPYPVHPESVEESESAEALDDIAHFADDLILQRKPGILIRILKPIRQFFIDYPRVKDLLLGALIGITIVGLALAGAATWGAAYGIGAAIGITMLATLAGGLSTGGAVGLSLGFVAFVSLAHTVANYLSGKCCVPSPSPVKDQDVDIEAQQVNTHKILRSKESDRPEAGASNERSAKVVPFKTKESLQARHSFSLKVPQQEVVIKVEEVKDTPRPSTGKAGSYG